MPLLQQEALDQDHRPVRRPPDRRGTDLAQQPRERRQVCARSVGLCRELRLLSSASGANDRSKIKSGNNRDRLFTRAKMARRRSQIETSSGVT